MSVMIIGEGILAQILSNSMSQTSLSSIAITSKAHEEFKQNSKVKDLNLVVSCGGSFEQRSRIAEACKSQSLKFLDCGIGYQQGHVQAIYPGESALFDTIVDHEDLSEDAPHCVTKSFPYTIDHCISWAVRKTSSWKKTRPDPKEDLTIKAKAKFHQHFIKKPQILLDNFPPGESPETWKKPKRVPRTDVELNFPENQLHAEVINALVQLFNFRLTDETEESEDEIEIPKDLENKLILALTKMRAFVYNIAADLEPDHALIRRARKIQHCQITVASLASALVLWELHKLEQSLESQDWWFSERNGFRILKSKTQLTMKTIGKLTLNPWENVQIQALCEWTLQDLLDQLEDKFGVLVEAVIQNGKSLFLKIMPTHVNKKRKPLSMIVKFDSSNTALVHIGLSDVEDLIAVQISS